jgi:DNA-binding transcriptional LysR family regulator
VARRLVLLDYLSEICGYSKYPLQHTLEDCSLILTSSTSKYIDDGIAEFNETTRQRGVNHSPDALVPHGRRGREHVGGCANNSGRATVSKSIDVMPDGACRMLLVPLIKHFNEHHPHLALRVMMAFRKTIPELIATGQVDLGIVFDTHPLPGIVAEPLATENMHLVGQVGEKVLRRATITTQEIAPLPLLLTGFEGGIRTIADKAFSAAGVTPNVKLEVDANDALLDLISEGLGFAILPYCTIQREIVEGRCAAAEIISPTIPRIVLLAISSSRLIAPATREAARAI